MEKKKERYPIWLYPETVKRMDAAVILDGHRSRSSFVERAINFYAGHIAAKEHTDYFAEAVSTIVSGTIFSSENRLARLHFKSAVEMAKATHILAAISDVDEETLRKLHYKCVEEVKRINGVVKFEEAYRYQKTD